MTTIKFRGGTQYPVNPPTANLTNAEKEAFHRDGLIRKKGLFQGDELKELVAAGESIYSSRGSMNFNVKKVICETGIRRMASKSTLCSSCLRVYFPEYRC
jgi:hypothetical protein